MKFFFVLAILLSLNALASGDDKCEQEFILFDKTIGDHSLMFYKQTWIGNCLGERSKFYTLFILPDRVHSTSSKSLQGNWVPRLYENMELEDYEILTDSGGLYYLNDTTYFSAPKFEELYLDRFNELPKKDVKTWHWECLNNCSVLPQFYNFKPEPIYYHPGGLYVNYKFSEVRYYEKSNFLILMTEQSLLDEKNKTMNGMIILKIDGYQW